MSATISEVLSWQPATLGAVADRLIRVRRRLYSLHDEIRDGGLPEGWVGDAAESATSNHTMLVGDLNDRVAEVSAALTAIDIGAEATRRAKRLVKDALTYARGQGFSVDRAALTVIDTRTDYTDEHERADRERIAQDIADQLEQALRAADHSDVELDEALRAVIAGIDGGSGSLRDAGRLGTSAGQRDLLGPPVGGNPADHAAWWNSLTEAEQRQVIAEKPRWIGNTDGIPVWARHRANVNLIPDHESELRRRLDELGGPPPAGDLAAYQRWKSRHDTLLHQLQGIERIEELLADHEGDTHPRQLLVLDITGDKRLKAAIGVGDVDTADHVTVFTPGLDSDVHDSLVSNDQRMLDLVKRAEDFSDANGSDDTHAAVFWLGYEAPQPSESLDPFRSVANDELARQGAPALTRLLNGIDASRAEAPHLTALGHSYGSLVTGLALRGSTGVDDALFMGSPGLGTEDVKELDVPAGHSYYLEADWDGVGDLGGFGDDPSSLAGVDTLSTDEGHSELLGEDLDRVTGHTSYFQDGSTSQYNAAAVMSGHPDEVIQAPETEPNPIHRGWEATKEGVQDGWEWTRDTAQDGWQWTTDTAQDGADWTGDRIDDAQEALEEGWKKYGPG